MSAETPGVASDKKQNAEAPTSKTPPTTIRIPPFEKGGPGGISGGQGGIPGMPGEIWNLEGIQLLTNHLEIWTTAETEKKSGRGRSSGNGNSVYGIKKLRELILELAVRGKLVPQDPDDEPAGELLKRIQAEKAKLVAEGKIKKDKPLPPISDEEKPFELPRGWKWVKLGNALLKITDGTHHSPPNIQKGDFKYISAKNIKPWGIDLSEITYVTKDIHDEIYARCDPVFGDILYIKDGATTGVATINTLEEPFSMLSSVALMKPSIGTNSQFLLKTLTSPFFYEEMRMEMTGVAITRVTLAKLNNALIPLPPLLEQHRIVAKVDELMALCDQLETQHINAAEAHEKLVNHLLGTLTQSHSAEDFNANWQRIAAHFDTLFSTEASIDALKQTLLQLAVMGKLVPQDPNDEPAGELLKRIQAEKTRLMTEGKIKKDKPLSPISDEEKPFELPQRWEWVRFGDFVFSILSGGTPSKNNLEFWNGDIPWASVKDLNVEKFLEKTQDYITKEGLESGSKLANKGDLLICTRMGLGKIAIAAIDVAINQDLKALKITSFLNIDYFINFYSTLKITGSGMTVAGIKQDELLGYLVPTPPLAEQHRIVTKVDELMTLCDQLKSGITQARQLQKKLADVVVEQAIAS